MPSHSFLDIEDENPGNDFSPIAEQRHQRMSESLAREEAGRMEERQVKPKQKRGRRITQDAPPVGALNLPPEVASRVPPGMDPFADPKAPEEENAPPAPGSQRPVPEVAPRPQKQASPPPSPAARAPISPKQKQATEAEICRGILNQLEVAHGALTQSDYSKVQRAAGKIAEAISWLKSGITEIGYPIKSPKQ